MSALSVFLFFLRVFAVLFNGTFINFCLFRGLRSCCVFLSLLSFKEVFYALRKETCLDLSKVIFNLFLGDVVYYRRDKIGLIKPFYVPAVAKDGLRSIFNEGVDLPPCVDNEWVWILYSCRFVWFRDDKLWAWYFFQILMSLRLSIRIKWVAG